MQRVFKILLSRKKIYMESSAAKRQKMSEPAQTSSNKDNSCISTSSSYIEQYNKTTYIDKTLLIERLFRIPEHALITAPRGFGKSLNMDMARKFFEIEVDDEGKPIVLQRDEATGYLSDNQLSSENFKIFEGKKIFKNKEFVSEHFGRYPILYVDFKDVTGSTLQEILDKMRDAIRGSFQEHAYLIHSPIWKKEIFQKKTFMRYFDFEQSQSLNESNLLNGLKFLSKYLRAHFGKEVYVFIDEIDAPVSNMIYNKVNSDDQESTIYFIRSIISRLVKSNKFVRRSLLTGSRHITGVQSYDANNIEHYPFMSDDNIFEFYGFTEAEVNDLLKLDEYKTKIPEKLYPQIHEWYNGYKMKLQDGSKINIYSPYAIVKYLEKPTEFYNHLIDNTQSIVLKIMSHYLFRQKIVDYVMSSRKRFRINYIRKWDLLAVTTLSRIIANSYITAKDVHIYMQFLYENGYFNLLVLDDWREEFNLTLEIPNKAIYSVIVEYLYTGELIKEYYHHDRQKIARFKTSMDTLAESRTRSDVVILAKSIEELLRSGTPPCNDFSIHSVLYAYLKDKFYYTLAESITSLGTRCDIYIEENEDEHNYVVISIVIKQRRYNDSEKAYKQIFDNKYDSLSKVEKAREVFKNNKIDIKNKIYLGIHVSDDCNVTITFSFDDEVLKDSNKNVSSNSP